MLRSYRPPGRVSLSPGIGDHERDRVPCGEWQVWVARDLVAIEGRDDVLVEGQPRGCGGVAEAPGAHGQLARRARRRQRPEPPELDLRCRELVRALIVGRLVEVANGLQA